VTSARRPQAASERRGQDDQQRALAALHEQLAAGIRALRTGENWGQWLQQAARLPGRSFANVLLIAAQRPGATLVAGYQEWQERGRQVSHGEPGIQVFAQSRQPPGGKPARTGHPGPRRGRGRSAGPGSGPGLTYVWDVTQTTGPPLPRQGLPSPGPGPAPPRLWEALTWLARREGFTVEREYCGPADSVTISNLRRIRVRPDLGDTPAAQALLHQLGHLLLHAGTALAPSTAGCRGIRKVEADSVGFLVSARLGLDTSGYSFPSPAIWAGTDPRARPEAAIQAAGTRITDAAATITDHLASTVPAQRPAASLFPATQPAQASQGTTHRGATSTTPVASSRVHAPVPAAATVGVPADVIARVLLDAERFYLGHLHRSWVPGYLQARGLDQAATAPWSIGYAPAGWTALTTHLRGLGHHDTAIEAAGLARRSSRGTLIDHFRDRVMLTIRNEHGTIAGFIGRAHPHAKPGVPKYLNSPETTAYTKGHVLFGLHEAREALIRGAVPVITEGPFDAIAVTAADPARYAWLAPCGTALTSRQAAALASAADLGKTGVIVAFDGDRAGRNAVLKAYEILLPHASMPAAAILPADSDPAQILQTSGAAALSNTLQHTEPLATVVIDAHLDSWAQQLRFPEGQLNAMRSAATLIARMLPAETASEIHQITVGRSLAMLYADLRPIDNPELPAIARALTPAAICQILQAAERTANDSSDIVAEVANTAIKEPALPELAAVRSPGRGQDRTAATSDSLSPAQLASASVAPCRSTRDSKSADNRHTDSGQPRARDTLGRAPLTDSATPPLRRLLRAAQNNAAGGAGRGPRLCRSGQRSAPEHAVGSSALGMPRQASTLSDCGGPLPYASL
jgi:DNA primase